MTICIGVGQCGVSCTDSLIDRLAAEEEFEFFYESKSNKLSPRAILVDTEPKAISKCIQCPTRSWSYDPRSTHVLGQSGAANNWACGYNLPNEKKVGIVESIQREAERCNDSYPPPPPLSMLCLCIVHLYFHVYLFLFVCFL